MGNMDKIGYRDITKTRNGDSLWLKGDDGLYRSENREESLTADQIKSHVMNGFFRTEYLNRRKKIFRVRVMLTGGATSWFLFDEIINCDDCKIDDGAYLFYDNIYTFDGGNTNGYKIELSTPVQYTIIEELNE
jgi:hypothetical protein